MTREEWTYTNWFNEEKNKWDTTFYKWNTKHYLTIKEIEKGLFCIVFDHYTDLCWFHNLEEAKNFWLWFRKWFGYCKDEMLREINTYFNS